MKLGIIVPPAAESFEKAKGFGLEFVEFDLNPVDYWGHPLDKIEAAKEEIKAASEKTGVEIAAVGRWASQIVDPDGNIIEEEWEAVKHVIDLAGYWGAKHYLCSVNYAPNISYYKNITLSIKILKDIVAYAESKGLKTSIVNCEMGSNYIRTPEQWKLVLNEVPGLTIKYDPSHSFVHGGDKGAYIKEGLEWGSRFGYCHVKGVIQYGESPEHRNMFLMGMLKKHPELKDELLELYKESGSNYDNPPAGIDTIDWRGFFAVLYKYDYDGYLAIEPHSMTWQGEKGDKGIQYTVKYIRDLMI
jgi:Sugar phosphate isomerases/epimerases